MLYMSLIGFRGNFSYRFCTFNRHWNIFWRTNSSKLLGSTESARIIGSTDFRFVALSLEIRGDGMKSFLGLLLLFALFLQPTTSKANLPSQITVGSYNLYGLRNSTQLRQDLAALNFVQIWAFQEVEGSFSEKTANALLEILPEGKWYLHLQKVNITDEKNDIWEGQVIASRFPIDSVEVLPLKHTDQKERVALIANFTTPNGQKFFFTNTDHEVNMFSIDFNDRKKQLETLATHFQKLNASGVITGDFNTTGGDSEIKSTEKILKKAAFTRAKPYDSDSYTFEKLFLKRELDHFFTKGVTVSPRYRYNERQGSDHFPIYMEVSL
jgi:endonuclease/exonuclease/phosphatase family metal-dependent hydrolase